jgi:hypothetical protein
MSDIRKMIAGYLATDHEEDEHGRCGLNRIAADPHAHTALEKMVKPIWPPSGVQCKPGEEAESKIWQLIGLCMEAEIRVRTFRPILAEERGMVEQLQRHRESVKDLKRFIEQATGHPDYAFVEWLPLRETDQESAERWEFFKMLAATLKGPQSPHLVAYEKSAAYYREALDRISTLIDARQETADEAVRMLGATREAAARSAAETAAIGFLAEEVLDLTSKPFTAQVARLAEIALGIDDVSQDRVRAALKARRRTGQLGPKKNRPSKLVNST